ncbi:hypothetical protein ACFFQF_00995 [Haladaptatus pallidirubidus]|uniref:hypothetical protein n=1 Tax=Haladaptatus pallidirubidus TaxID=1008152 RepID=UPI001D10FAA0|nr:hypothetical protein [Haladaptatus pallidirubidus]
MKTKEKIHLGLGVVSFLLFLALLVRQEVVPDYTMSRQAIILLAAAIYATMQIDILRRE